MKLLINLLLLAFLLCSFAGYIKAVPESTNGREPKCESYMVNGCPRIRSPVCGSDNNSYENECLLCSENLKRNIHLRVIRDGSC
ncbi:hypothetical protein XENTR_v10008316 [Xenopus tropicalis]|uniref:Serine protease inhibitor Kazal-type 1 n=1 Tax=Xenopus tropicalis TaxID=8364 RepID=A0A8J0QTJ6_XENTR|eukprot:XP_002939857.1 PREDICTED: serine protease inhibitor Kazal-type 1-like [Xenopus tropicalis]